MKSWITRAIATALLLVPLGSWTASATHDPNDFFALEASFPGVNWGTVMGSSATDVHAVGQDAPSTAMAARYNGVTWALQTLPALGTRNQLTDLWVISSTSAYTIANTNAGTSALLLQWTGAAWTTFATQPPITNYNQVWGSADNNLYVAGDSTATVYRYNGATWADVCDAPCATPATLGRRTLYGVTSADIWYNSPNGLLRSVAGANFDFFPLSAPMRNAWGSATNNVWAVDVSLAFFDGTTWAIQPTPKNDQQDVLEGIWGNSATDIWAVGSDGLIIHRGGAGWTLEPTTTTDELTSVWCADASNCWIVAVAGNIFRLDVNPAVAIPSLAGFTHDPDLMMITASQAPCIGLANTFTVNTEPPLALGSDLNGYVIDASNVVVELLPEASWTARNDRAFKIVRTYPEGSYSLLVTIANVIGGDPFMEVAFSVQDSCAVDGPDPLLPVVLNHVQYNQAQENTTQDHLNHTDNNVTHLHAELHNQFTVTNSLINTTHTHIDLHFTEAFTQLSNIFTRLNTTCQKTAFSAVGCEGVENLCSESGCNITVDNQDVITALGETEMRFIGLTTEESWTLLALIALMIWALYNEWWWAFSAMLLGVLGVTLGLAQYNAPLLVFLIILGFALQLMVNKHHARREREREAQQASA